MKGYLAFALMLFASTPALAAPSAWRCQPVAVMDKTASDTGAALVRLTPEQWQFIRGASALDPNTPPGLPPGDSAKMLMAPNGGAMIIFIDGDKACGPMIVPKEGVDLLMQVGRGDIVHAEAGPSL